MEKETLVPAPGPEDAVSEKPKVRFLSARQILGADDIKIIDVDVPEWNGVVRLRMMTAAEAAEFDTSKKDSAARLVVLTAVDEEGQRLFSNDDIPSLQKKALRAFVRLQEAGLRLNGLLAEDVPKTKNV